MLRRGLGLKERVKSSTFQCFSPGTGRFDRFQEHRSTTKNAGGPSVRQRDPRASSRLRRTCSTRQEAGHQDTTSHRPCGRTESSICTILQDPSTPGHYGRQQTVRTQQRDFSLAGLVPHVARDKTIQSDLEALDCVSAPRVSHPSF